MQFLQLVLLGLSGAICTSLPTGSDLRFILPVLEIHVARIVLEDLTAAGILRGSVDEMMAVNLGGR